MTIRPADGAVDKDIADGAGGKRLIPGPVMLNTASPTPLNR